MTTTLTVSIGVSSLDLGEGDADVLLEQAQHALAEAKRGGRNRVRAER